MFADSLSAMAPNIRPVIRRFVALSCLLLASLPAASAFAAAGDTSAVDIVELEGPMDQRLLDFAVHAIETSDAQLVVLQIDSSGISSGDPTELRALLADPPVPLLSYIGLRPARALGGAGVIALEAPLRIAAPGVEIGLLDPMVIRSNETAPAGFPAGLYQDVEAVDSPIPDVIDFVEPSLVQLIIDMDGVSFDVGGEAVVLATAKTIVGDNGEAVTVPAGETRFVRPGLWTRFLRLASTPEKMRALSVMPGSRWCSTSGPRCSRSASCRPLSRTTAMRSWRSVRT